MTKEKRRLDSDSTSDEEDVISDISLKLARHIAKLNEKEYLQQREIAFKILDTAKKSTNQSSARAEDYISQEAITSPQPIIGAFENINDKGPQDS